MRGGKQGREILPRDVIALTTRPREREGGRKEGREEGREGGRDGFERSGLNK